MLRSEKGTADERRILIVAPTGQDAPLISQALARMGMHAQICADVNGMLAHLRRGAALFLLAEEALSTAAAADLKRVLEQQEPWSDMPLIVLTSKGDPAMVASPATIAALSPAGNVTLLERPLRTITLVHAARAALRARNRQYHVRDLLREREHERSVLDRKVLEIARSNAELEQFAFIAAHDLQEPIRMIISYLQLMEHDLAPHLTGRSRHFYEFVLSSSRRMKTMVRGLLDYSRIGKEEQAFAEIDSMAAVRQALDNLRAMMTECRAVIEIGPLPVVLGSHSQIVRLVQNLVANSLKFRSQEQPAIVISAVGEAGMWVFSVSDNGIGITPDEGGKLFGLFQRLHASDKYPGTGIGLAACRKIVEQHGGRIWFTPNPVRGTTFHFSLPAIP